METWSIMNFCFSFWLFALGISVTLLVTVTYWFSLSSYYYSNYVVSRIQKWLYLKNNDKIYMQQYWNIY